MVVAVVIPYGVVEAMIASTVALATILYSTVRMGMIPFTVIPGTMKC